MTATAPSRRWFAKPQKVTKASVLRAALSANPAASFDELSRACASKGVKTPTYTEVHAYRKQVLNRPMPTVSIPVVNMPTTGSIDLSTLDQVVALGKRLGLDRLRNVVNLLADAQK